MNLVLDICTCIIKFKKILNPIEGVPMKRIITSFAFFITFVSLTFSCLAQESEATQSLIEAIRLGDLPRLQSLVAENVDLNAKDDSSNTALLYAINADRLDIVKLLLDNGANTNQKLKDGGTVLISVIETNHPKALERVFPPIPEEVIFLTGVFGEYMIKMRVITQRL